MNSASDHGYSIEGQLPAGTAAPVTLKTLMAEALSAYALEFATDAEINGGDLLEWFADWRLRAELALEAALTIPPDDLRSSIATVLNAAETFEEDWSTGVADGTYDKPAPEDHDLEELQAANVAVRAFLDAPARVEPGNASIKKAFLDAGERFVPNDAWCEIIRSLIVAASAPPEEREP